MLSRPPPRPINGGLAAPSQRGGVMSSSESLDSKVWQDLLGKVEVGAALWHGLIEVDDVVYVHAQALDNARRNVGTDLAIDRERSGEVNAWGGIWSRRDGELQEATTEVGRQRCAGVLTAAIELETDHTIGCEGARDRCVGRGNMVREGAAAGGPLAIGAE